jgi:hypothetical protein
VQAGADPPHTDVHGLIEGLLQQLLPEAASHVIICISKQNILSTCASDGNVFCNEFPVVSFESSPHFLVDNLQVYQKAKVSAIVSV